jgi:hypothetical protein
MTVLLQAIANLCHKNLYNSKKSKQIFVVPSARPYCNEPQKLDTKQKCRLWYIH